MTHLDQRDRSTFRSKMDGNGMRRALVSRALKQAFRAIVPEPPPTARVGRHPPAPVGRLEPLVPPSNALVSVGVPVRNGANYIAAALESLIRQTHENLEVVISDNASTDDTPYICERFAARDSRIRFMRQPASLNANANFCRAFEDCGGDWFMWAGHDDLRHPNYVEVLLDGFRRNPRAPLIFTDFEFFADHADPSRSTRTLATFMRTEGLAFPENHRALVQNSAFPIYGLFRRQVLRMYPWPDVRAAHDWLVLHWALTFGDPVYVPGSLFQYYLPPVPMAPREYRRYHSLTSNWIDNIRELPHVGWALHAARELAYARNGLGQPTSWEALVPLFSFIQYGGVRPWAQIFTYANSPPPIRQGWRRLRSLVV